LLNGIESAIIITFKMDYTHIYIVGEGNSTLLLLIDITFLVESEANISTQDGIREWHVKIMRD